MPPTTPASTVNPDDGDVVEVEASKNLTTVVSVRLSVEDLTLIEQAASRADMKLSAFLRNPALSVARDEEVIGRSEAVAAVEALRRPCRPYGARQARTRIACSRSCRGGRTRAVA